jgi:hypothetical protein
VLGKIDPLAEPKESTATSDCDDSNTIIDTLLAPNAQVEDFVGDYIYIRNQPTKVDSGANINEGGTFSASDTTLTVDDGTKFTVDDAIQLEDEICGITGIATHDLTLTRGIQGSTAATHVDGTDVYIVGPAIGEIARVTNATLSSSTSTLTIYPALSGSMVSGQEYERHRKVRPNVINDKLATTLGLLRQNAIVPVTIAPDGDMEDTGTITDTWTDGTTDGSIAKGTSYVRHGRQSLTVTEGAGLAGAATAAIAVPGGTQLLVAVDCYITSGDAAEISLHTATTSGGTYTERETATSDEAGWVHLEFLYTTPQATEWIIVKLKGVSDGDVIYYDHLHIWPTADKGLELPSFLEFLFDAKELVYYPVGTGLPGSSNDLAYRINESEPQFYAHYKGEQDDTGVVPARLYFPNKTPSNALWLRGRKAYPDFAGATDALKDVATTVAHRHVVANMTAASIIDDFALEALEAEKFRLAEQLQIKALLLRSEIRGIVDSMTPPKKKKITSPFTR